MKNSRITISGSRGTIAPKRCTSISASTFFAKGDEGKRNAPLDKQNVVLWHSSSALHVPRAEDGIIGGNNLNNGQAMVYWTTFELRPRNLFSKTPIYRSLP